MARRALLTEGERDALQNPESRDNPYVSVSRVRNKIEDELPKDVEILQQHADEQGSDLLDTLQEIVCEDSEGEDIAEAGPSELSAEPVEAEKATQAAEDVLRDLDLPESGESRKEARMNAVLTFYEHLREHRGERVSRSNLQELADDTDLDVGYASFTSLWNNWVKANDSQDRNFNTLAQLPGVEMDGDDYVYTGETA
jgi:hypothetical protein